MMNMVLSNFMSNAIKYCDHIIMIQLNRNGRKIDFSITNDGAKIEKKDLDKIWDIFYTTDKARTDRMSSSGVGLSVVKSILDVHKADYSCVSGDKGTEFKFSMPAHETA
jgi:signal transduction histidine kinase